MQNTTPRLPAPQLYHVTTTKTVTQTTNANTQIIPMLSDIINGNAYLKCKLVSIHQMETLKVQVASVSIYKIETHQHFRWSTDQCGKQVNHIYLDPTMMPRNCIFYL